MPEKKVDSKTIYAKRIAKHKLTESTKTHRRTAALLNGLILWDIHRIYTAVAEFQ